MSDTQYSDDALYFLNSSDANTNLFDASEDPTGKRTLSALPDFDSRGKKSGSFRVKRVLTSAEPGHATGLQL